ncbi:hypothetical protein RQP46_011272 [Phenoliferia psychrophenolica]
MKLSQLASALISLGTASLTSALGSKCNGATLGGGTAASSAPYWYETINHLGSSPYAQANYKTFRNVKSYGAKGDGVTDDGPAIAAAISDGGRCGLGCSSTTTTPAVVYFPSGNYFISKPIIAYYYTTLLGDAKNPPTLTMSASFSNDGTGYNAAIEADPYVPNGYGANYWTNQNNFFRSVRNFIIDTTRVPPGTQAVGIHWQVAQATSLQDLTIKMSAASGTQHVGIYMENGSGGFMSDVATFGGFAGFWLGNQQFTFRKLSATNAVNGVYGIWNWGMTFMSTRIDSCTNGFFLKTGGDANAPADGANYILDTVVTNTKTFVLTTTDQSAAGSKFAGSIIIDNAKLSGVQNSVMSVNGVMALAGGNSINLWIQGTSYTPGGTRSYGAAPAPSYSKPAGLLDGNGNVFGKSRPQYASYAPSQFISVKASGAKGDGVTDDTSALNAVFAQYSGCKIIYIDAGTYKVTNTIQIPVGATVIGEFFPVILASGANFADQSNPRIVVKVGNSGDSGSVELGNIILSTVGGSSGAIMMEWNVAASSPGSAGAWDTHMRLGGAKGTNIDVGHCRNSSAATDGSCNSAYLGLHVTPGASGMFENMWMWAADHDLDDQGQGQVNSYSARGVLIESTAPSWFVGTANFQPKPAVPSPFRINSALADPTYPSGLTSAWALYIQNSKNVLIGGAGFYSFFSAYDQSCLNNFSCQSAIVNVDTQSTGIRFYNLNTVGSTYQLSVGGKPLIKASDNTDGFQQTTSFWSTDASSNTSMHLPILVPTLLAILTSANAADPGPSRQRERRTDFRGNTCTPNVSDQSETFKFALGKDYWQQKFMFNCDLYACMRSLLGADPVDPGWAAAEASLFQFLPGFGSGVQITPQEYSKSTCLSAPAYYSDITVAGCGNGTDAAGLGPPNQREWIISCNACSNDGATRGSGCSFKVKGYGNQCISSSLGSGALMHLDDCDGEGAQLFDIVSQDH